MKIYDAAAAFRNNELEANKYTVRCMGIIAIVVAIVWILNLLHIFIVPQSIMAISASAAIALLLLPAFMCKFSKTYSNHTKIYIMVCCTVAITLLASAMPKHGIIAWATPIALSCHYYSKKFTWQTYITSAVFMAISLPISAYFGEWDVSIFGVGSTPGVRIVDAEIYKRLYLYMFLPRVLTLAGICVIFITLSKRTRSLLEKQVGDSIEKQRIASELNVASQIQTSMLPCIFPAFPNRTEFEIYASMNPAKEVGGDFYDFFLIGQEKLAFLIADVSGKGIPAALFMMIAKSLIKGYAESGRSADEIFTLANEKLCESNDAGMFVTAWLGIINLNTGELEYANAGHNPPLVKKANGGFEYLNLPSGFVLAGMEGIKYRKNKTLLKKGDRIYLYTDGVTESTNEAEALYGEDRLRKVLNESFELSAEGLCNAVKNDIDAFVGNAPQFDDITMLCFDYIGKISKEITVAPEFEKIPEVTEFVENNFTENEVPMGDIMKMNIAIDEIFSNIVKFSKAGFVRVVCYTENSTAVLVFEDDGIEYNPLNHKEPDIKTSVEDRVIGGLGIFMVKKSMTNMEYEYKDGKNILTLKLDF